MGLFGCEHKWKEAERFYAPPVHERFEMEGAGAGDIVQRMAFGVTTIVSKCETCGDIQKHEILGKVMTR